MIHAKIGNLDIGTVPRVVGTITTLAALRSFPQAHRQECDIAEVRLDVIGVENEWTELAKAVQACGVPTLLTLRTVAEGGKCELPATAMLDLVQRAWPALSALDVEHFFPESRRMADAAHNEGKAVLASFHDFNRTPGINHLTDIVEAAGSYADIVKISTFVKSPEDVTTLEALLRRRNPKPLCVIGMGPLGSQTRTEFPLAGSCLTFGYLDAPAAPGQLSAAKLVEHLREALPAYAASWAARQIV